MIDRRSAIAQMMLMTGAADAVVQPLAAGSPLPASGGVLGPGEHHVDTSLSIAGDLLLLPGARIRVAPGSTLTLRGDLIAPVAAIFTGGGRVDLNACRIAAAHPEWWGARTDDGTFDNLPALEACVAAHPVTQLQCADYFIADTWRIETSHRAVRGVDNHWSGPGTATRIVVARGRAGAADVIQIGPDHRPAGDARVFRVQMSKLHLTRDGVVASGGGERPGDGPAGLRLRYAQEALLEDITAENHGIGFYVGGVVHSFLRRCVSARTGSGRDAGGVCYGFLFDGDADLNFAGGNASIYVEDCTAVGPGPGRTPAATAALLLGAFADTYLIRFECAGCTAGIAVRGLGASTSPRAKTGNADVHIIMPILDQCGHTGIEIAQLTDYGLVDIVSPYVAPATGALAALHVHDGAGLVTVTGGQVLGYGDADAGGNGIGVHGVNASGLVVQGLKLLGCRRPLGLTGCRNFDVQVAINNPAQPASQAAVQLAACEQGAVRPLVRGGSGVFPQGVRLDGQANRAITVDVSGIDPGAVAGGGANRLWLDRTPIRSAGPFGGNLASGLFA